MTQFNLFDQVKLAEPIDLVSDFSNAIEEKTAAPIGTSGTIVEVLSSGEAFLVELFGDWIKDQDSDGFVRAKEDEEGAFRETLGVEIVYPQQIVLQRPANTVKVDLFRLLDEMPENHLAKVKTFAESL